MTTRRHFIALLPALGVSLVSCKGNVASCSSSQSASIDKLVAFAKANFASPADWNMTTPATNLLTSMKPLLASMEKAGANDTQLRTAVAQAVTNDIHQQQFVEDSGMTVTRTELLLIGLSNGSVSHDQLRSSCAAE